MASRLSEDPNRSVLVLERGLANSTWMSRIPLVGSNILNPDMGAVSWYSEAMKHCGDRPDLVCCGEALGGTSPINGMIYTRGSVADYDSWASTGYPERQGVAVFRESRNYHEPTQVFLSGEW